MNGTTIPTSAVTLAPIFEAYRNRLIQKAGKAQTIYLFVRSIVPFQSWLDEKSIAPEDVTEDALYEYRAGSPYSQGTKRTHEKHILAAYRYAHQRGAIPAYPFVHYVQTKEVDNEPRAIPVAELRRMRDACQTQKQSLLWGLLAYTGMRRDEIRRLRWDADSPDRVDLEDRSITVVGKGDKRRTLPIHPKLQRLLEEAPDSQMRTVNRAGAILWTSGGKNYSAGNGFDSLKNPFAPDVGFHAFRRTVATSMSRNGVQSDTIDKIMGWAPAGIRAKYYVEHTADDLRKAINMLYVDEGL